MLQLVLATVLALGSMLWVNPAPEPSVQLNPNVQVK